MLIYKYIIYSFVKLSKIIYPGSRDDSLRIAIVLLLSSLTFWSLVLIFIEGNINFILSLKGRIIVLFILIILAHLLQFLNQKLIFKNKSLYQIIHESDKYSWIPAAILFFGSMVTLIIISS